MNPTTPRSPNVSGDDFRRVCVTVPNGDTKNHWNAFAWIGEIYWKRFEHVGMDEEFRGGLRSLPDQAPAASRVAAGLKTFVIP